MASLYGLPARSFARHLVSGSARRCATAVARFADAGAQHVAVFVTSDDPLVQFEDLAGELAGLVPSHSPAPDAPPTANGGGGARPVVVRGSQLLVDVESAPVATEAEDPVRR